MPDEQLRSRARALAAELELPLSLRGGGDFDLLLVVAQDGLELREVGCGAPGPVRVCFGGPRSTTARRGNASSRQPIAQAVGLKRHKPDVVDATAGLGRDTLLLACMGCTVTAIERSPVLGVLLRDALERAATGRESERVARDRIRLIVGDARAVLSRLPAEDAPAVVYLDPRFPPRKKSVLPKKELRILRRLVGEDPDAGALLDVARRVARRRVVVKRTPHAPPLAPSPTMSYEGKIARYDVYLTQGAT